MLIVIGIIKYLPIIWLLSIYTVDVVDRIKQRKEYNKQGSELVNLQIEQKKLSQELKKILENF